MRQVVPQVVVAVSMKIELLEKKYFPSVSNIYTEGLATGIASFETNIPDWENWDIKFLSQCRYVVIINNEVVAWCGLSPVSKREVYKGVAEDTLYVSKLHQGKGIGKKLLLHLIKESEKLGFWTLQAGIFSENKASIKLHQDCGFRIVGVRESIAKREGKWHDNVLMERRSIKVN
ncbi:MAG: L-amino acid N-acyltransferase YncA [Flavobacteriaceae bacterium]|jgi:L-amino acid N-acyltransferase YncA